mmetsp:Transcript_92150/g.298364  ORF Transcript_92150/g.298364 Transcript_92150/m.298364 type:complete len:189 (+) Transcript_92150:126-692(+)
MAALKARCGRASSAVLPPAVAAWHLIVVALSVATVAAEAHAPDRPLDTATQLKVAHALAQDVHELSILLERSQALASRTPGAPLTLAERAWVLAPASASDGLTATQQAHGTHSGRNMTTEKHNMKEQVGGSTGTAVGISVAVVLLLLCICLYCYRRRASKLETVEEEPDELAEVWVMMPKDEQNKRRG